MRVSGMIRKIIVFSGLSLMIGCMAVQPIKFVGPNGKTAYTMKCSGMGRTLEDCYIKAGEVCPNGYSIVDRATGYSQIGNIGAVQHSLAVECK